MTQGQYKICPRCNQPAALDVQVCGQCGRHYQTQFIPQNQTQVVQPQRAPPQYAPPVQIQQPVPNYAPQPFQNVPRARRDVSPIWTFFFGCFYFFFKGWWKAGIVSLFIGVFTGGIAWFIIPFFAQAFVNAVEDTLAQGVNNKNNPFRNPTNTMNALQQLADLYAKGIITDAEFQAKKVELLNQI